MIHAFHAISVYDRYSQYMILSPAFACCIYFLSLDNEGPEAGEHNSNSPAPYLVQDYIYEQLLGNQENTVIWNWHMHIYAYFAYIAVR